MTPEQLRQRRWERKIIRPTPEINYDDYDIIVGEMEIRFVKKRPGAIIPFPYQERNTAWQRIKQFFTRG